MSNLQYSVWDMVAFKTPHRVDWDRTGNNVALWIVNHMPGVQPSAAAMMSEDILTNIKRRVMKLGVYNLYKVKQEEANATNASASHS